MLCLKRSHLLSLKGGICWPNFHYAHQSSNWIWFNPVNLCYFCENGYLSHFHTKVVEMGYWVRCNLLGLDLVSSGHICKLICQRLHLHGSIILIKMHLFNLSLHEIGPLLCWGSITIWVSGSYPCVITRGPSPPQATRPPPISAPHWGPFRPPVGGSNRYASQTSKVMLTSSSTREQAVKHSGLEGFFRASFFRQELLSVPRGPCDSLRATQS